MAKSKARRSRTANKGSKSAKSATGRKRSLRRFLFAGVVAIDLVLVALFTSLATDALSNAKHELPNAAAVSSFAHARVAEAAQVRPFDLTIDPPVPADVKLELPFGLPTELSGTLPPAAFLDNALQTNLGSSSTKRRITNVNVTFYDCANQGFCGRMYNGRKVYEGAAACSWNLVIGTRFRIVGDPTGRTYICEDRGLLANTWVDIFFYYPADGYRWQAQVGRHGTIEIVN
jgi:hypothetical protein